MRPRLPLIRSVAAGFLAAVVLTACGSSGDEEPAAGSSSASSSSTSSSAEPSGTGSDAPQADSEFCTEAGGIIGELQGAFLGTADPAAAAESLRQAVDRLGGLEAPPEIAADWTTLTGGLREFADAFGAVDPNDPESLTRFQQSSQELQGRLLPAATSVQTYLTTQCGFQATTPAAPTS
jgi:hypothetical protein